MISSSVTDIVYRKENENNPLGKISLKIKSGSGKEFSRKITLGEDEYIIASEDLGPVRHLLTTRVYHKGRIISTHEFDYADFLKDPDLDTRLAETARKHHQEAVTSLKREKISQDKTYEEYISAVGTIMQNRKPKEAFALLTKALEQYPNNPFIFSYQGYLDTVVNRNPSKGIKTCREAFTILKEQVPFGEEFFQPVLYLNLGKAYLAAGKKKEAYTSFHKGLAIDPDNKELVSEMRKLGERKSPPVPFLDRSNLLNKLLGRFFHIFKRKVVK